MTTYQTNQTPAPSESKFVNWSGRTYVVQNWEHRENKNDAVIVHPLDKNQADFYNAGKQKGHSDTSLFYHIFPEPEKPRLPVTATVAKSRSRGKKKVNIDIAVLYKEQLIGLIEKKAKTKINGLSKLDRKDLEALFMATQE